MDGYKVSKIKGRKGAAAAAAAAGLGGGGNRGEDRLTRRAEEQATRVRWNGDIPSCFKKAMTRNNKTPQHRLHQEETDYE